MKNLLLILYLLLFLLGCSDNDPSKFTKEEKNRFEIFFRSKDLKGLKFYLADRTLEVSFWEEDKLKNVIIEKTGETYLAIAKENIVSREKSLDEILGHEEIYSVTPLSKETVNSTISSEEEGETDKKQEIKQSVETDVTNTKNDKNTSDLSKEIEALNLDNNFKSNRPQVIKYDTSTFTVKLVKKNDEHYGLTVWNKGDSEPSIRVASGFITKKGVEVIFNDGDYSYNCLFTSKELKTPVSFSIFKNKEAIINQSLEKLY